MKSSKFLPRPIRSVLLSYRRRQQLPKYKTLLREMLTGQMASSDYFEESLRQRIRERAVHRRPLDMLPHIVAFGAHHWESYGYWPSLARISHLDFYNYAVKAEELARRCSPSAIRCELGRDFLNFVDRQECTSPVQVVFFYADSRFIAPELLATLRAKGIWTVLMGLDDKHRFQKQDIGDLVTGQRTVARCVDIYWTSWKVGVDLFLNIGANPWYAPPAADPVSHRPVHGSRPGDVVFVGQCYGRREKLIDYLRRLGFSVRAFGQGWPAGAISHERTVELFSTSVAVLGVGDVGALSEVKHLKGRDFEVPMCGGLYLTTFNPELTDFFKVGSEILCYSSFEECAELLHWVRRHPQGADAIRQAGLRRSLRDHTWEARFSKILSILRGLPAGNSCDDVLQMGEYAAEIEAPTEKVSA